MKKILSIVLALALVFGFAGMTLAMGPDGADPATVGFVLTSFTVSDSIISPLMMMNWSGTLQPTKTYAEGQPIWFIAGYVQNKLVAGDDRNFATGAGNINSLTTVFTSSAGEVNYSYSSGYMNFVEVLNMQVVGGTVSNPTGSVSATAKQLEVEFTADTIANAVPAQLEVIESGTTARNYYLQIMAFTNACNEAQGTAIAKMPIDRNEFTGVDVFEETIDDPANAGTDILMTYDISVFSSTSPNFAIDLLDYNASANVVTWLALYDANNAIKYYVKKFVIQNDFVQSATGPSQNTAVSDMANIGAKWGDSLYMVYGSDGAQIIGFVSSGSAYRGMAKYDGTGLVPVQYNSDLGGKYVYTAGAKPGEEAVGKGDLEAVMTFLNFSFGNSYPVLDKHFHALAGYWKILEAKYNVAAAVITNPDPGVDIVPKTGDVSSAFGMIMVAIAGLAAVGFVMMKRVHG